MHACVQVTDRWRVSTGCNACTRVTRAATPQEDTKQLPPITCPPFTATHSLPVPAEWVADMTSLCNGMPFMVGVN